MVDFQNNIGRFEKIGVKVIALSADSKKNAQELMEKHKLTCRVCYGIDAGEIVQKTGAYMNEAPPYLHATGFILRPDGTVAVSVYSSGPIGRLVAQEAAALIEFYQKEG